jgi:putative peptide maturation system protein
MNQTLERALIDSLDCLVELGQEGAQPEEARRRLRLLQAEHSDIKMGLLWEEQPYDRSVHYDMLLHPPTHGTISLSFCPDRGLPWPLRGVHRSSEMDLVRVNKTILRVDQAIACLDFMWEDARAMKRLVDVCLVQEALDEDPIELTEPELQLAMDRFRRAHKLYRAADTFRWMQERGMTQEQLERRVRDEAIIAKLREKATAPRVEDYFESHRADFDTAAVARIVCTDEGDARRAYEEVRRGALTFYGAAQDCFLTEIGRSAHRSEEVFTVLKRREVPPEVGSVVFAASPGDLIGPLCSGHTYTILHILSVAPARLDTRTRSEIQKILFDNWIKDRREAAVIEWLWGNTRQTSLAAAQ